MFRNTGCNQHNMRINVQCDCLNHSTDFAHTHTQPHCNSIENQNVNPMTVIRFRGVAHSNRIEFTLFNFIVICKLINIIIKFSHSFFRFGNGLFRANARENYAYVITIWIWSKDGSGLFLSLLYDDTKWHTEIRRENHFLNPNSRSFESTEYWNWWIYRHCLLFPWLV